MTVETYPAHKTTKRDWLTAVIVVLMFVTIMGLAGRVEAGTGWHRATSSYYGPADSGGITACSHEHLTNTTRGVAHKTLPCGTRIELRSHGRRVMVKVIDRGPFIAGRTFDLTIRTAKDLCGCSNPPGVLNHLWRLG